MSTLQPLRLLAACALALCALASPATASHFRGGNVNVEISATGVATFTYETLWRKGTAFFPFDGVGQIQFFNPTDTSRNSALRTVSVNIGTTTVFRDVSDPAFDLRRQVVVVSLPGLGLAQGRYVARWENCCRIAGIRNAPEDSFSLETVVDWTGTANGSPVLNSRILTVVGKALVYAQNLNAFDPDGRALSYQFLVGAGRPTYGPSSNIPGILLDAAGKVEIPATATATLFDINPFNPAGDYVFKVRVSDATGVYSERDVLLDVVATANLPPILAPIGNRVLNVGEAVVLPISATDPNLLDRVTLRTSTLAANMSFVSSPGNPASGTLAFRPASTQVGTFGINLEARDNGTPILTASELVTLTVLDPNNRCPVLAPIGNRETVPGQAITFAVSALDPDAAQSVTLSASFLPPGATFSPSTGVFSWTPTAQQSGVFLGAVFEARDSASPPCVDREVVGFSVAPANRFPVLAPLGNRAAIEGSLISFLVGATDPDGNSVALSAQPLPVGASFDPATGRFSWRPSIGQTGVYEVTFRASDNGSPMLSDEETIRISVAHSGQEPIRFIGLGEGQKLAGTLVVEAQLVGAFAVTSVSFAIDGNLINTDLASPFFLGGELNGLPVGVDTATLDDGLHTLTITAIDNAGQTTIAQRDFTTCNFVPPEVTMLTEVFDGAVVSGTIFVEAEALDDQQVVSVSFEIDGTPINTEPTAPYFLNGGRLPKGTFDVSCRTCLRVGDTNGDLVVVGLEEDGTIERLCQAQPIESPLLGGRSHGHGTPDGVPPSDEEICDLLQGQAFGLCNAFCQAQDCDAPGHKNDNSCAQIRDNFTRLTEEPRLPCEALGACIGSLTLGVIRDPSLVETFDHDDFSGALTTFELEFPIPVGFDTNSLADGPHLLTIVVTDNRGLTTTVTVPFYVDNVVPPGALTVALTAPANNLTAAEGRVLDVAVEVGSATGPVTVKFYADGRLLATDLAPPFATAVLVPPASQGSLLLHAVADDGRGPRQAGPVRVGILGRPEPLAPISVTDISPEKTRDGKVAVDSPWTLRFSSEVDAASLVDALSLTRGGASVGISVTVAADGLSASLEPVAPLIPDALHQLVIDGARSVTGASAPRVTYRFLTFPDVAIISGRVLADGLIPLAGVRVHVGAVAGLTNANGVFELVGVSTGEQVLVVEGAEFGGRTYPPLEFVVPIVPGVDGNQLRRAVILPGLDLVGGLDVVNGVATGSGILTSTVLPGASLDLRGVTVRNGDGSLFTGRMSITPVPAPNVPMPAPVYSSSYITVQPAVHLDPPAPITYPNLDGALPGEIIPLWHFDHERVTWTQYGRAMVSADGLSVVSNPGEGLPATGWGSPQPPNTTTTVKGKVVDKEGNPLHGCRVVAGNVEGFSKDDGSFSLANVPAGRQGSPIQISANVTAKDIEEATYTAISSSVTAVQNGTTDVGEVKITSYGPILDSKIKLHADFEDASKKHILKVGSALAGNQRYKREVEEFQKRLKSLGFRQGGSASNHGMELAVNGTFDETNTKKAARLFQTLELQNGNSGTLAGDGIVGKDTITELNKITEGTLWGDQGATGGVDYGCPNEPADGYGTPDLGSFLGNVATVAANDASNPSGGDHPDHSSHETGIDIDISLPRTDTGGCAASPGWGAITVSSAQYDRAAMRAILQRAIDSGVSTRRWLNDTTLQAETHGGVALCTSMAGHDNHVHIRIDPSLVDGGVNAKALILGERADGSLIRSVSAPGSSNQDVAVDGILIAGLSRPFDVTTLSAATVRVVDPTGAAIQGDVLTEDSGLTVQFKPVEPLSFATTYRFVITTGAVLADGELLVQPSERTFTTEADPSLRVVGQSPPEAATRVPADHPISITLDGPVDPRSLGGGAIALLDGRTGQAVPFELSLDASGTTLTLAPAGVLAELRLYRVVLGSSIKALDGSSLVPQAYESSFTTALSGELRSVAVAADEVRFTRADLSDRQVAVSGTFADGSVRDLSSPVDGGTDYFLDRAGVVFVDENGSIAPVDNGEALIDVSPALDGYQASVRVVVAGVFPVITFAGRQFDLTPADDVVLRFSEPVDRSPLGISDVVVELRDGTPVAGSVLLSADGQTLTFDPTALLPLRQDFLIRFNLHITDDRGVTRTFERKLPFATAAVNLGFELGDFTGFATEGDVTLATTLGTLHAPEGNFMAKLITSDAAVNGRLSKLQALDLVVPAGARNLVFTYNFLSDELEQGQPFNDFFRATMILPDGRTQTVLTVTRDQLFSQGVISGVPGFDRMTGFRRGSVSVSGSTGGTCHLVLEVLVTDVGDASIDSAVLVDDIHFE